LPEFKTVPRYIGHLAEAEHQYWSTGSGLNPLDGGLGSRREIIGLLPGDWRRPNSEGGIESLLGTDAGGLNLPRGMRPNKESYRLPMIAPRGDIRSVSEWFSNVRRFRSVRWWRYEPLAVRMEWFQNFLIQ
jgi:hypothetical protein